MKPRILALCKSATHTMVKPVCNAITLLKGLGVEGDAHMGITVKHRSRVRQDPTKPNLRQVHLIHSELLEELLAKGLVVKPGQMGENITTQNIDLLALAQFTQFRFSSGAIIEVQGLRNPCVQLEGIQPGLMEAVLDKDEEGNLIRKAGIMGTVLEGGILNVEEEFEVILPALPHQALFKV
jgi:MOSC domain-containing protein YiiM